jgi:hypothetical protein
VHYKQASAFSQELALETQNFVFKPPPKSLVRRCDNCALFFEAGGIRDDLALKVDMQGQEGSLPDDVRQLSNITVSTNVSSSSLSAASRDVP